MGKAEKSFECRGCNCTGTTAICFKACSDRGNASDLYYLCIDCYEKSNIAKAQKKIEECIECIHQITKDSLHCAGCKDGDMKFTVEQAIKNKRLLDKFKSMLGHN